MTARRRLASIAALALCSLGLFGARSASAEPVLNLDIHHNETHFPPGSEGQYWVEVDNVGDTATSGPVTLRIDLPPGITRRAVFSFAGFINWTCPGKAGTSTLSCTTNSAIRAHSFNPGFVLSVKVAPEAEGTLLATAEVEGGGSAVPVSAEEPTEVSSEPASFGIVAPSFVPDFFKADGLSAEREAGAHPDLFTVPFDLNTIARDPALPGQKLEAETIRDLHVDTPPGFIGNPSAVGECTQAQLTVGGCPPSSQVGREDLVVFPLSATDPDGEFLALEVPVYNLTHPRGVITDLAFQVAGNPIHIKASLDPANHYAITSEVANINENSPAYNQKLTLWGVPADHSHDSERFCQGISFGEKCRTDATPKPFLSIPSQCETDNTFRLHHYDSWQHTGVFGPEIDYTMPGKVSDCEKPRFEPDVEIEPTGKQANTPTGLDVHVRVAQNENPNALATPPLKRFTVRLPEGMSFSPSFADGLKSCTLAQMELGNNNPVRCPDASRIGEVSLHTPLLPRSAEGSMYLAAQHDNPFDSTFALLLELHDTEERGALIKIPGRIDVDENTGQITTVFQDTPQFPFDDLTLKFRSGPRAPLVSPPSCGEQTIGVEVASYAQPQKPVDASNHYEVTEGPNGTSCPPGVSKRGFNPSFNAGTLNPVAGSYSTFLFRLSRQDQEQELNQVTTVVPPGLVAKLAGVTSCPDALIDSISEAEGTGIQELNHPACPSSSQMGTVSAGLGAGPGPNYFDGKVYLAGPYKGAPLSLAIVFPAIAGPIDLGSQVVRVALRIDPETTQVTAVSDPFPTILHGVILRVRDVRLRLDRPETTINPTNCSRMSVDSQISGVGGALVTPSVPFQVSSCSSLGFKPNLALHLFGGTRRGSHPRFQATLRMPKGGANIAMASVALPHSEFLDQGHIGTVCTRPQFASETCPAASIYGTITGKTPLLDETLHGNIYLRSSNNPLPDLVFAFRGGRIPVNAVGRVDSIHGGIRTTFEKVPDAPIEQITVNLAGGKKGLLVNSRNICKGTPRATVKYTAQNGDKVTYRPPLQSSCSKTKKKGKGAYKRHR